MSFTTNKTSGPGRLWGPPSLQSNGYRGREGDHSPPPTSEVKNTYTYTSSPSCIFLEHGNNFTHTIVMKVFCKPKLLTKQTLLSFDVKSHSFNEIRVGYNKNA
jgi:hypothetical protein